MFTFGGAFYPVNRMIWNAGINNYQQITTYKYDSTQILTQSFKLNVQTNSPLINFTYAQIT